MSPLIDLRNVHLPPAFTIAAQMLPPPLAAAMVALVRALYVEADKPAHVPVTGSAK